MEITEFNYDLKSFFLEEKKIITNLENQTILPKEQLTAYNLLTEKELKKLKKVRSRRFNSSQMSIIDLGL